MILLLLSILAKILYFSSRILGKGSGTSLPGLIIEKYFRNQFWGLFKGFKEIILISGTNGKTTTRAALVHIFEKNHYRVCTNRGGANILRGLASSLLLDLNFVGRHKSKICILEVEEASLPILTRYITPTKLILTNIFRDQLDAYGEVDKTFSYFSQTLRNMNLKTKEVVSSESNLVTQDFEFFERRKAKNKPKTKKSDLIKVYLNYDDKKLLGLLDRYDFYSIGFGLELDEIDKPMYEQSSQVNSLPDEFYLASNIISKKLKSSFTIKFDNDKEYLVETLLPGSYNIYNTLVALIIGYEFFQEKALSALNTFEPVFGRGERISLNDSTELAIFLIKNPAGFDQVLKLIQHDFENKSVNLAIAINDKIADGRDVSWLWDVDIESFIENQSINELITSGTRGMDMLLRLQYAKADVKPSQNYDSFDKLIEKIEISHKDYIILATYTATLNIRSILSKKTTIKDISSDGF